MELHLVVQSEPLPQLPDDGSFTPEFRDFARACLGMAPEVTPSHGQLQPGFVSQHFAGVFATATS
jgi:hypothetical protein